MSIVSRNVCKGADLCAVKPNCVFLITSFSNGVSRRRRSLSKTLLVIGSRLIGRCPFTSLWSFPGFGIIVTVASFQEVG